MKDMKIFRIIADKHRIAGLGKKSLANVQRARPKRDMKGARFSRQVEGRPLFGDLLCGKQREGL